MRTVVFPKTYSEYRGDSKNTPSGVSCVVLNDPEYSNRVIKCYRDPAVGKDAKRFQKAFWRLWLAPEVFDDVEAILGGEVYQAFSCEKVKTFRQRRGDGGYGSYLHRIKGPFKKKAIEFERLCDATGIGDTHLGNFGILGDKIVMIDFGFHGVDERILENVERHCLGKAV